MNMKLIEKFVRDDEIGEVTEAQMRLVLVYVANNIERVFDMKGRDLVLVADVLTIAGHHLADKAMKNASEGNLADRVSKIEFDPDEV